MIRLCFFSIAFAWTVAAQDASRPLPSADYIVSKMIERDNQRQTALQGYTASRRYVLENSRHHKRAEMLVAVNCLGDGSKEFSIVSSFGWGVARSHVFPRLLQSESEASLPDARERSRISPENYSFATMGEDYVNERSAWVLALTPKTQNKYLIKGRIWVDPEDYAIVRIEGKPAKNPSFWIKSVQFVHTYQKSGPFWLPGSDRSVTDARILGATELTIEYFDYAPNIATLSALRESTPGSEP